MYLLHGSKHTSCSSYRHKCDGNALSPTSDSGILIIGLLMIKLIPPPGFSGGHVARSLFLCAMLCRSFFALLSFLLVIALYVIFYDLRLRITALVSFRNYDIWFYFGNTPDMFVD